MAEDGPTRTGGTEIKEDRMMKRTVTLLVLLALLCAACSGIPPQGGSVPGISEESGAAQPDDPSGAAEESPGDREQRISVYPRQAAEYTDMSRDGSLLVSVNGAGEKTVRLLPGVRCSDGRLSPEGNAVLCKTDVDAAGDGRFCGYRVFSLEDPRQGYDYDGRQMGFQDHIWLDQNLIGYASAGFDRARGITWGSVRLFDGRYNPLDLTLTPAARGQSAIVGIGYDKTAGRYILVHAENQSTQTEQFSVNRMILSLFDSKGAPTEKIPIPEEYQCRYSANTLSLYSNNPAVTADGNILLTAQKKESPREPVLLAVSIKDKSIREFPYGDSFRLLDDGKTVFATAYVYATGHSQPALLRFDQGGTTAQELPLRFAADGYGNGFIPRDAAAREGQVYWMAENATVEGRSFGGLFYWDSIRDPHARDIRLLEILPASYSCSLVGVDGRGACHVLIEGDIPLPGRDGGE